MTHSIRKLHQTVRRQLLVLGIILLVGALSRVLYVLVTVDLSNDYYWEYGEIVKNMHAGNGYALYHSDGVGRTHYFSSSATPSPSAYMPPGYVFFLWPFFLIENVVVRSGGVLLAQIAISTFAGVAVYFFTERFVHSGAGLWAAAIYAFLPEFVYATSSFTPTVHYHLGTMALLYLLQPDVGLSHLKRTLWFAAICVLLIYLRSEFALFAVVSVILLAKVTERRYGLLAATVILLLHLPWQVRNYSVFHEWIPLTTSSGLNFFRGHNELGLGAWSDDVIVEEARRIPDGPRFEPELSRLYFGRAVDFIRTHPLQDFLNDCRKVAQFWLFDPGDERTRGLWYIIPWSILLVLSVGGMVRARLWRNHKPVAMYLVYATFIAAAFFVLPRYQSMMKIVLIPFAAKGAEIVKERLGRGREVDGLR